MPSAEPLEKALTRVSSSRTTAWPCCTEPSVGHSGCAVISAASTKIGKTTVSGASRSDSRSSLTGTKKLFPASAWIAAAFSKPSCSRRSTRLSPRT